MNRHRIDLPLLAVLLRQLAAAERRRLPLKDVAQVFEQDPDALAGIDRGLHRLLAAVGRGMPLSAALGEARLGLAPQTLGWVAWGEQQGTLAEVLESLAQDIERRQRDDATLGLAFAWPACVALAIVVLFAMVSIFVLPAFAEVYGGIGAELPALTRHLLGGFGFNAGWGGMLVLLFVLVLGVLAWAGRLPPRLVAWGHALAGGLGFVRRLREAGFATRLLGLLQRHHADRATLEAAFGHLAATTATPSLAAAARGLQGAPAAEALSRVLAAQPAVPARIPLFVRLGETMGELSAPLAQLGEMAEHEHALALARFERGSLLLVYLLLGAVVGTLVLGVYLPIFKLGAAF